MAGPLTILVGRFARALARKYGLKGPFALDLSPELQAVDNWFPEDDFLNGVGRAGASVSVPAGGAGKRSTITIINPTASGVLTIIEGFSFLLAAANNLLVEDAAGAPVIAANARRWLDDRWGAGGSGRLPSTLMYGDNTAAATGAGAVLFFPGGLLSPVYVNWILSPGTSLAFEPNADVIALTVGAWWRERPVEPSELSL